MLGVQETDARGMTARTVTVTPEGGEQGPPAASPRSLDPLREGGTEKTRHLLHLPPFLRHTSSRRRVRYPNRARAIGPSRREDDNDLHPCPQPGAFRRSQPGGWALRRNLLCWSAS